MPFHVEWAFDLMQQCEAGGPCSRTSSSKTREHSTHVPLTAEKAQSATNNAGMVRVAQKKFRRAADTSPGCRAMSRKQVHSANLGTTAKVPIDTKDSAGSPHGDARGRQARS